MKGIIVVLVLFLVSCTPELENAKVGGLEKLECSADVVFACEQGKKNIVCDLEFKKPVCDFMEKNLLPTVTPTLEGSR